jgi:hypothetical protein
LASGKAEALGIALDSLVDLRIDTQPLSNVVQTRQTRRAAIAARESGGEDSIQSERELLTKRIALVHEQLERPSKVYAAALESRASWEDAIRDVEEGTQQTEGIRQVNDALNELSSKPGELRGARTERLEVVREIHRTLMQQVAIYRALYEPARAFIESHPLGRQADLEFGVTLTVKDLPERLWSILKRNTAGSFQGTDEGDARLKSMMSSTDFTDEDAVIEFVEAVDDAVHRDVRVSPPVDIDVGRLLRAGRSREELYDLVFGLSYLEPDYFLQSNGIPIDQLSPGQKGNLLLMFYLLVDPNPRPLLLDQPDETLDNQTIKDLLVPAIKEAKSRRQVIVVTHNPNVAVVADADQVVTANFDGQMFTYDSGAIESRVPNEHIVDVLEGTWPAFENREAKYLR